MCRTGYKHVRCFPGHQPRAVRAVSSWRTPGPEADCFRDIQRLGADKVDVEQACSRFVKTNSKIITSDAVGYYRGRDASPHLSGPVVRPLPLLSPHHRSYTAHPSLDYPVPVERPGLCRRTGLLPFELGFASLHPCCESFTGVLARIELLGKVTFDLQTVVKRHVSGMVESLFRLLDP